MRRRRFVPTTEAQTTFATSPGLDWEEVRADLDEIADDEPHDPFEGTGL